MGMVIQELIATVSVGHNDLRKAASLYLVHFSNRQYAVYICSENDDQVYNIAVTKSSDAAIEAFKFWTGILIGHGKDYLLEKLKSPKE